MVAIISSETERFISNVTGHLTHRLYQKETSSMFQNEDFDVIFNNLSEYHSNDEFSSFDFEISDTNFDVRLDNIPSKNHIASCG